MIHLPVLSTPIATICQQVLDSWRRTHGHSHESQMCLDCGRGCQTSVVDMKTIQAVLGHSDYRLAADTYTHVEESVMQDAAGRMGQFLRSNG